MNIESMDFPLMWNAFRITMAGPSGGAAGPWAKKHPPLAAGALRWVFSMERIVDDSLINGNCGSSCHKASSHNNESKMDRVCTWGIIRIV